MNQPPSVVDAIGLAVLISAAMFSPDVAAVVGPYLVIIASSAIGASFALIRRDVGTRVGAAFYFLRVCGLATLITVVLSSGVALLHPSLTERMLIAPVALGLGLIGDDYPIVGRKIGGWIGSFIDALISLKSRGNNSE